MATQAGWYPDNDDPHTTRYWDGTAWTAVRVWNGTEWVDQRPSPAPAATTTSAAAPATDKRKLYWIGGAIAVVVLGLIAFSLSGSCGDDKKNGWTAETEQRLRNGCLNGSEATEDECQCVVDYTESHYTAAEINGGKFSLDDYKQGVKDACT